MKRILIYALLLGSVLLLTVKGTDVGELVPVELVYVYKEGQLVKIVTDQGEMGAGVTVGQAMENLKETTPGIVFLDTADFLLIDQNARDEINAIKPHLKPTTRVCVLDAEVDLKQAAGYLRIHKPALKLGRVEMKSRLEILRVEAGRFILNKD